MKSENVNLISIKEELKKEIEIITQKKLNLEQEREYEIEELRKEVNHYK